MSVEKEIKDKVERIRSSLATYPDFPKKGILFYDIMPILINPTIFQMTLDVLSVQIAKLGHIDAILALESRGFLFGPTLALQHKVPFLPIRKKGKLPGPTKSISYSLEYGEDTIEIQDGPIKPGSKVVVVDDLLATGGTLSAAIKLIKESGSQVVCSLVIIELQELDGASKVESPLYSMLKL